MAPLPYYVCIIPTALSVGGIVWLVENLLRKKIRALWWAPFLLTLAAGLFLGIRFTTVIYDYAPGWRVVGFPMAAAYLKLDAATQQWLDYIGYPPLLVFLANFAFWLLTPGFIVALAAWKNSRKFRTPLP